MILSEFKLLLEENQNKYFQFLLPDATHVPVSFHITEVGLVVKTFIDCGGTVHTIKTCQLQVWVGEDVDHKIEARKMLDILNLSSPIVKDDSLDVEIEYEKEVLSQYRVTSAEVSDTNVVFQLAKKHTDCLAKELCGTPSAESGDCCTSKGCC